MSLKKGRFDNLVNLTLTFYSTNLKKRDIKVIHLFEYFDRVLGADKSDWGGINQIGKCKET